METDTLKSIEDGYEEEFELLVEDFRTTVLLFGRNNTEDEIREAFEEAMNKVFA